MQVPEGVKKRPVQTKLADLLKPVTNIISVTVLSRVVTGFVCTVTAESRVVTGMFSVTGCHGFCYISHGKSREMSLLFIVSSRPFKQLPER